MSGRHRRAGTTSPGGASSHDDSYSSQKSRQTSFNASRRSNSDADEDSGEDATNHHSTEVRALLFDRPQMENIHSCHVKKFLRSAH